MCSPIKIAVHLVPCVSQLRRYPQAVRRVHERHRIVGAHLTIPSTLLPRSRNITPLGLLRHNQHISWFSHNPFFKMEKDKCLIYSQNSVFLRKWIKLRVYFECSYS